MNRQAYEEFFKLFDDMENTRMHFLTETDRGHLEQEVRTEIEAAKELGSQGERRIALEDLLENLIEIGLYLTPEQIKLADRAFGKKSMGEQATLNYYREHLIWSKLP